MFLLVLIFISERAAFFPNHSCDCHIVFEDFIIISLNFLCLYHFLSIFWVSLIAESVKNLLAMQETREDPLEKETAIHSSILAWKIPRTEEPGQLQSMGLPSRTRLSD